MPHFPFSLICCKHIYKSYLYLAPYCYYFENKFCVTVILSCFRNLFLSPFLKWLTSFLKHTLKHLFHIKFNGKPFKTIKNLGLYCPPVASSHLVNQQGGQQPSLTTKNVDRGHFYTQPFNLCLCWRHSCCGQEVFPRQLAVDDAQLILVICEEQEEHQWRSH